MKKFFGNVLAVLVGNFLTFVLVCVVLGVLLLFSALPSFFESKTPKESTVLEITLNSAILESKMDEEVSLFSLPSDNQLFFRDILNAIKNAKEDDKISGISLKVDHFSGGSAQLLEIRDALEDFKDSGKFIYAYTHNANQGGYMLSTVADSIYQNPMGLLLVQGLSAEVMFFKNLGDKYGIDFQVIRHGDYKSAVEPYMRDDLSEENREQLSLILGDIWSVFSKKITSSRNISLESWNTSVDSLYSFIPESALKHNLVDKLVHEAEYDKIIAKKLGINTEGENNFYEEYNKHKINLDKYASLSKPKVEKDQIAIIYASGAITHGNGYSGIQSELYKKTIRQVKNDDKIKAVVLRINSPGGSADASEEILYELRELRKTKPIIVSFGDVAASGGYYIAMEADSIFASPATITGSIGVLGMVPNAQKLANNIGITTDYVSTNENADFLKTVLKPMSPSGMDAMTKMTENVYHVFVNHVMAARNMTYEQVDSIGGGRVWSGVQAKKLNLIDAFGGIEDAIQAAADKANLDKYSTVNYPYRKGGFEEYLQQFQSVKSDAIIQEQLGKEYYDLYLEFKSMREFQGIQLRSPFLLKIK